MQEKTGIREALKRRSLPRWLAVAASCLLVTALPFGIADASQDAPAGLSCAALGFESVEEMQTFEVAAGATRTVDTTAFVAEEIRVLGTLLGSDAGPGEAGSSLCLEASSMTLAGTVCAGAGFTSPEGVVAGAQEHEGEAGTPGGDLFLVLRPGGTMTVLPGATLCSGDGGGGQDLLGFPAGFTPEGTCLPEASPVSPAITGGAGGDAGALGVYGTELAELYAAGAFLALGVGGAGGDVGLLVDQFVGGSAVGGRGGDSGVPGDLDWTFLSQSTGGAGGEAVAVPCPTSGSPGQANQQNPTCESLDLPPSVPCWTDFTSCLDPQQNIVMCLVDRVLDYCYGTRLGDEDPIDVDAFASRDWSAPPKPCEAVDDKNPFGGRIRGEDGDDHVAEGTTGQSGSSGNEGDDAGWAISGSLGVGAGPGSSGASASIGVACDVTPAKNGKAPLYNGGNGGYTSAGGGAGGFGTVRGGHGGDATAIGSDGGRGGRGGHGGQGIVAWCVIAHTEDAGDGGGGSWGGNGAEAYATGGQGGDSQSLGGDGGNGDGAPANGGRGGNGGDTGTIRVHESCIAAPGGCLAAAAIDPPQFGRGGCPGGGGSEGILFYTGGVGGLTYGAGVDGQHGEPRQQEQLPGQDGPVGAPGMGKPRNCDTLSPPGTD